ncbi:hypothetical protein RM555_01325 [Micromonospora sp. DSM 115977]|uniref:Uncharacterized protein n=1 Tax=Micromonospora reichwaldensis TaxID=3075516 RepID=A0ABU2WNY8_9ACTN|nr:hypothetical protein [Micromonospora sp. DSM 115977]MDT0527626.1 hypothetical protein [Micromonospora sp. DSM 115977]
MARRGWGGSIAIAVGVAAGAGAAQLGFGYGLGIINWAPADATAGGTAWVAGLIWATWIAATSTVFGAVCAQRLRDRAPAPDTGPADAAPEGPGGGVLGSAALAVAAGVGALITVLLVAVPARQAVAVADTGSPRNVAAAYAAVGVLVGVLTAAWALRSPAAANNVLATVGWLWLLAVIAVVDGVLAGRGLTSAQLGIWQLGPDDGRYWIRDYFYWPGALLSLGSALVIGALAARRDARNPDHRVGAAASGAAGPLLVATAYFLAVPRLTAISPEQVSAHLIAPYAVIVGVGGAVLVTVLAQRAARRAAARGPVRVPRQRTGGPADHPGDPAPGRHTAPADGTDGDAQATPDGSDTRTTPWSNDTSTTPDDSDAFTGSGDSAPGGEPVAAGEGAFPADREPAPVPAAARPATASGTPAGKPAASGTPAGEPAASAAGDGTPASATTGEPSGPAVDDPVEPQATGRRSRSSRRTR